MNEKNLDIKYLVLKIEDINATLNEYGKEMFWTYVERIIKKKNE